MTRPRNGLRILTQTVSINLTEELLLQHFSATDLLGIATRALTGGKIGGKVGRPKLTSGNTNSANTDGNTVGNGRKKSRKKRGP